MTSFCLEAVSVCQRTLNAVTPLLTTTTAFDRLLRCIYKGVRVYTEYQTLFNRAISSRVTNVCRELRQTIDYIGVGCAVYLVKEMCCPDQNGRYLFQTASWAKLAGRISLMAYSFFCCAALAARLQFLELKGWQQRIIGQLTLSGMLIDASYSLYTVFRVAEVYRSRDTLKVTLCAAKAARAVVSLFLRGLNIHTVAASLALYSIGFITDLTSIAATVETYE